VSAALPRLGELLAARGRDERIELELSLGSVRPDASADVLRRRVDELAALGATCVSVDFGIRSAPGIGPALTAMRHFAAAVRPDSPGL
jgi:hypothetical protein